MAVPDGLPNWKHRWRPSFIAPSLMRGTSAGIPAITSRSLKKKSEINHKQHKRR